MSLFRLMIAALSLFGLASCFQVENTISVNKDGSGTITETMLFGDQMKMMLDMAAAQGGGNAKDPFAEMKKNAAGRAKKLGEGVEFVSAERIDEGGKLGMKIVYKFSDINKLKYSVNTDVGMNGGAPADKQDEQDNMTFKLEGDKLTILQKHPDEDKAAEALPEELAPQMLAMMQGMMKDMRVTTKIKIESGIAKTDATHVDGDVITIADIQMGNVVSDPEKLKAIQSGDFDKIKEAMEGVDGVKFEDKESVSVQMK